MLASPIAADESARERLRGVLAGVVAIAAVSVPLCADTIDDPFRAGNRNPLVQIYGMPAAMSADINSAGNSSVAINADVANAFSVDDQGAESIMLDGESYRANLHWRYGVMDKLELGIDLPWISHQGGGLDGFIEDWHDTFSLPEGDRVDYPKDQLNYLYSDGRQTLALNERDRGWGDLSLSFGYQLSQTETSSWALRGGVKFATGDAEGLQGSEGTDGYLGLNFSHRGKLVWHASGGVLMLGDGEVLDSRREDWVGYGSGTLSWPLNDVISLKTQLDMHTAFYDSSLTELGDPSAQLLLGGSIRLADNSFLDISVSEDIAVDTAPDVVFMLGLRVGEF